jgi:hypothetical protein
VYVSSSHADPNGPSANDDRNSWTFVDAPSDDGHFAGNARTVFELRPRSSNDDSGLPRQDTAGSVASFAPSAGPSMVAHARAASPPQPDIAEEWHPTVPSLEAHGAVQEPQAAPVMEPQTAPVSSVSESAENREHLRQTAASEARAIVEAERHEELQRRAASEERNRNVALQLLEDERRQVEEDQHRRRELQRREEEDRLLAQRLADEEDERERLAVEARRRLEREQRERVEEDQRRLEEESRRRRLQEQEADRILAQRLADEDDERDRREADERAREELRRRNEARVAAERETQVLFELSQTELERRHAEEEADRQLAQKLAAEFNAASPEASADLRRLAEDEAMARALVAAEAPRADVPAQPGIALSCQCLGASQGFHRQGCLLRPE